MNNTTPAMRQPRLKAPPTYPVAFYHVISRVVDRQFHLQPSDREQFVKFMRQYERFCGLRVLTYCFLSNHFHILLEIPGPSSTPPLSDPELLERCAAIYPPERLRQIQLTLDSLSSQPELWAIYRQEFLCRMGDLSQFLKSLKQRFTQWFNGSRPQRRKGTLWEERFKSVLVEGTAQALSTLAAYIDLNPVRAGLVTDPKNYRWSGYGAAAGGDELAIQALETLLPPGSKQLSWYRRLLYAEGMEEGIADGSSVVRRGIPAEDAKRVWDSGGELSLADALACRIRYFADGAVLGSRQFANEIFELYRSRFGVKRQDGARPLRRISTTHLGGLFTLRNLRVRVLEIPQGLPSKP